MRSRSAFPIFLLLTLAVGPNLLAQMRDSTKTDPLAHTVVEVEPTWNRAELQRRIVYPELARRRNIEGETILRMLIGRDGRVKECRVHKSSGSLMLDSAAVDAVTGLPFTPATQDGKPVLVWVEMPINFKLNDPVSQPESAPDPPTK